MYEQRKILEQVIERHEDHSFRIKAWFAAIAGGLAAALHLYGVHFTAKWELLAFMVVITVAFALWLTYHRIIVDRATARAQEIEHRLSDCRTDGNEPEDLLEISKWLSRHISWEDWWRGFSKNPVVLLPTIIGIVLLALIWLSAPEPQNEAAGNTSIATSSPNVGDGDNSAGRPTSLNGGGGANSSGLSPPNGGGATPIGSSPFESLTANSSIILLSVFVVAMGAGCFLLIRGSGFAAKTTGMISVLAGLLTGAHFVLVKEAKVESIFSLKDSLKDLSLTINWGSTQSAPQKSPSDGSTTFGAQYLGSVRNFRIGSTSIIPADFDTDADFTTAIGDLGNICSEGWQKLVDPRNALVIIIGHTDRLRLLGSTQMRYETNTGLALSRASAVRDWLTSNCWKHSSYTPDPGKIVLLGAGPLSTPSMLPAKTQIADYCAQREKSGGFQCDRRVDVYALATISGLPITPAGEAITDRDSSSTKHAATQLDVH